MKAGIVTGAVLAAVGITALVGLKNAPTVGSGRADTPVVPTVANAGAEGVTTASTQVTAEAATPAASSKVASEPKMFTSWEDALRLAKDQNKLVMVDIYTDWCGWCKRLDKDVYSNADVQQEATKYFTAVKLNAESNATHQLGGKMMSEREIASGWRVTGYPTIVFMTPSAEIVQMIPGYVPAKDFQLALRFIGSGAYRDQDFQEWKKKQG